ncbi:EscU/YscU/HrcU family type III secretion system export apparatus switch protein [Tautonia rosea]|uniref:EscU/YscU/HrcU family type III secretion system export apparatus switch protein n=1 Tax=Tautonia rosea TaxID=2728037 RepID=UPI001473B850|nr:EscU/YscU/HrcU family type III secretion system export apparatus switch protein [Tautonia rosea]
MSDDRTLEPSPRRLREAREQGMLPHSPELTASVGILAAVAVLGASGGPLIDAILGLMQTALAGETPGLADPQVFVHQLRSAIGAVAVPMLGVLVAPVLAALLAHQLQMGGLFVPSLALPNPARLWSGARGGSPADRLGRALGIVLRASVLIVLTWWLIRSILARFDPLAASADRSAMLRSLAAALHGALLQLGLAMLVIGLIHYAIQYRRLHAQLRMTPEERREEQRSNDGDPSLRSRRRAARERQLSPRQTEPTSAADPI